MNTAVSPTTDGQAETLKQPSQFPGGYGQSFSSPSENTVDQPDIPQETLQSGERSEKAGWSCFQRRFWKKQTNKIRNLWRFGISLNQIKAGSTCPSYYSVARQCQKAKVFFSCYNNHASSWHRDGEDVGITFIWHSLLHVCTIKIVQKRSEKEREQLQQSLVTFLLANQCVKWISLLVGVDDIPAAANGKF